MDKEILFLLRISYFMRDSLKLNYDKNKISLLCDRSLFYVYSECVLCVLREHNNN
jgi:hypothetical protein